MANFVTLFVTMAFLTVNIAIVGIANAQGLAKREHLPWKQQAPVEDPYAPTATNSSGGYGNYDPQRRYRQLEYQHQPRYEAQTGTNDYQNVPRRYNAPAQHHQPSYDGTSYNRSPAPRYDSHSYSQSEIIEAGHHFFGKLSEGLAKAIETVFRNQGQPTGYILGEDAGGAFVAGLRYGEGYLHTKYGDRRKIFWQGPSLGYDFGGEGNRTMVLIYNLKYPSQIYRRFGGVQGSAYVVGGASVQILKSNEITLAPIRAGVGFRLGANIGYLKYTRRPTWNPF